MTLQLDALRNTWAGPFSLSIDQGSCLAVTGASGSGKSVFLRMVADMDTASGSVLLGGIHRAAMSAPQWRKTVTLVPAQAGWWTPQVNDHFQKADLARRQRSPASYACRTIF